MVHIRGRDVIYTAACITCDWKHNSEPGTSFKDFYRFVKDHLEEFKHPITTSSYREDRGYNIEREIPSEPDQPVG